MADQILPVTSDPNQSFESTLLVDGDNIDLQFFLRFNEIANYWVMTITDPVTGDILLDSLPIVNVNAPAANLLEQYAYLGIGSMYVLNMSNTSADIDSMNLGSDYVIAWCDNP